MLLWGVYIESFFDLLDNDFIILQCYGINNIECVCITEKAVLAGHLPPVM